jgi:hypothetical protein
MSFSADRIEHVKNTQEKKKKRKERKRKRKRKRLCSEIDVSILTEIGGRPEELIIQHTCRRLHLSCLLRID